jgi:hypothetical protein
MRLTRRRARYGEGEHASGFKVDDELERGRSLDPKVRGLFTTAQNAVVRPSELLETLDEVPMRAFDSASFSKNPTSTSMRRARSAGCATAATREAPTALPISAMESCRLIRSPMRPGVYSQD